MKQDYYNIKQIKPNKILKFRINERGYGRKNSITEREKDEISITKRIRTGFD